MRLLLLRSAKQPGLLIAYSSDSVPQMLELLGSWNVDQARVEGGLCASRPRIRISRRRVPMIN